MEQMQLIAPYLLLFHVLCPFAAGLLLLAGLVSSDQTTRRLSLWVQGILASSSLLLLGLVYFSGEADLDRSLRVAWPLPAGSYSPHFMSKIVWGIVPSTGCLLCLVPWLAMTAELMTPSGLSNRFRIACHLLTTGSVGLFIVGWDAGSILLGAFLSAMLISLLIAQYGEGEKRTAASSFLTMQVIGIALFGAGLAMLIASVAVVRSAPRGLPGDSLTSLPELMQLLQASFEKHSASLQLWGEYRTLPGLMMLAGVVVMGAIFPIQVWLSEVSAAASLAERLWLVLWVKVVLLVGLRWITVSNPAAISGIAWWGLAISIPGALFVSSLLYSQAYLPRLQSSALAWTQQIVFITALTGVQEVDVWIRSLTICFLAAMVLLTVVLTIVSERYDSIEIASFQGLSQRAPWLVPALAVCTLTLGATPLGLGLMNLWLATATLLGSGASMEFWMRMMLLLANLLALAGIVRIARIFCTGPLRIPEMAAVLRERADLSPSTISLNLNWPQVLILTCWGGLAIMLGGSFPLRYIGL